MKNNLTKKLLLLLTLVVFIACLFTVAINAEETEEHVATETMVYKNGFTKNGTYKRVCSCGQTTCSNYKPLTKKAPLFVMNGFSMPENEDNLKGLSFSYQANVQLIEDYERINNCKITYGFLLSGAKNFENKPEKIKTGEFEQHFETVDVRINYGKVDANGQTKYDKYDVIFAGRVTVEDANGIKTTTYFQLDMPTTDYENGQYGTMIGINYDTVSGKQNDENTWQDNQTIDIETGELISGSSQVVTNNYIKVNEGDTIGIPSSLGVEFTLYCYNYVGGEYEYVGYVDCNGASEGNWSNKCTISEGNVVLVNNGSDKIDFNEFYVRMVCKSTNDEELSYSDIQDSILFNVVKEPDKIVTVTFKDGDNVYEKECIIGTELGKMPSASKENVTFIGWGDENDTTTVYTEESVINASVTLVPVFNEFFTDVKAYLEWSQSYMIDETGGYLASDASRYLITSLIKVNEGDTISIPSNSGHRLIIYCYSDQYGTYVANSIIDCNSSDSTSSYENWGYSYTFKNSNVLENGNVVDCENLYVRVAFRKDDSGKNGSVNIDTIKNNVSF
ncbi:MAG: InlB B-repeat-containing protein, partial [Clostridia bacterium]|nr:InlB B-repeat-containing protein [Clostridia bacterium]